MTVREEEDDGAFLRLHHEVIARKGMEPYLPDEAFGGYLAGLRAARLGKLFLVRDREGMPGAGQAVLLGPRGEAHTALAAGNLDLERRGAAALLRLRTFDALAAQGVTSIDLTDAALNAVTRFKSQLGGELQLHLLLASPRGWAQRAGDRVADLLRGLRALGRGAAGRREGAD